MPAPYSSKAVANAFLSLAEAAGVSISPMKLQKMVYFAHGWNLVFFDTPLIKDEIQAWRFGPVVQEVYHEFKEYGNGAIDRRATDLRFSEHDLEREVPEVDREDEQVWELLREVWKIYAPFSAIQLSNMTHAEGSPWKAIADKYKDELPRNVDIPDELIKECFEMMRKEGRGA